MLRLLTLLVSLVCATLSAQSAYEAEMQKGLQLFDEGKTTESSAIFEKITPIETNNWLPLYYVSLTNTFEAFGTKDKEKVYRLLTKAQEAQDKAVLISPENPELLVMQAMIHTAWIAHDPMTNGMRLTRKVNELYAKAEALAPQNPRVVLSKAEFDMGSATFFGQDTAPICGRIEKSIKLFEDFKPESPLHPNWGLTRAKEAANKCNK